MPANPIHVTALSQLRHSDFRRHDPLIPRTDNTVTIMKVSTTGRYER